MATKSFARGETWRNFSNQTVRKLLPRNQTIPKCLKLSGLSVFYGHVNPAAVITGFSAPWLRAVCHAAPTTCSSSGRLAIFSRSLPRWLPRSSSAASILPQSSKDVGLVPQLESAFTSARVPPSLPRMSRSCAVSSPMISATSSALALFVPVGAHGDHSDSRRAAYTLPFCIRWRLR